MEVSAAHGRRIARPRSDMIRTLEYVILCQEVPPAKNEYIGILVF